MRLRGLATTLLLVLAWGVLSFGAVYPWGYWPLAGGAVLIGVWGIAGARAWLDPRAWTLTWALLAVAAAISVQLIPLPNDWVAAISPHVDSLLSQYELGYRAPATQTLTVDPQSTWISLGLFLALSVLLIGLTCALTRVRLHFLVREVLSFGVALALFGIIQRAVPWSDADHPVVYGFWKPQHGIAHPFGPYINRNHFAGWMLMILPIAIGYSIAILRDSPRPDTPDWRRWVVWISTPEASRFALAAFSVIVMGTSLVLTQSRSGIVSFAAVLVALGLAYRRRLTTRTKRLAVAAYLTVLLVGALGIAGLGRTVTRFQTDLDSAQGRLNVWHDALHITHDFPWVGTGIGAFGRAMLVYQTSDRSSIYVQAHDDYLQLAAEGGVLIVIPAAILAGVLIIGIVRRFRRHEDDDFTHWIRVGATAGLIGIAVQSLVEFSLQTPGNTVTFVLLLAIALHRPRRRSESARAARV